MVTTKFRSLYGAAIVNAALPQALICKGWLHLAEHDCGVIFLELISTGKYLRDHRLSSVILTDPLPLGQGMNVCVENSARLIFSAHRSAERRGPAAAPKTFSEQVRISSTKGSNIPSWLCALCFRLLSATKGEKQKRPFKHSVGSRAKWRVHGLKSSLPPALRSRWLKFQEFNPWRFSRTSFPFHKIHWR